MRFDVLMCMLLIYVCSLPESTLAHDFGGREKNNIKTKLIEERKIYDACVKKAGSDSQANEQCRKDYALKRMFSMEKIFHLYMEHPIEAEDIYTDLHLAVKGSVSRVGESALGFPEVIFALDAFGLTGVRCEFAPDMAPEIATLTIGTQVTLGGICKGLFNDKYVRLTHCELLD